MWAGETTRGEIQEGHDIIDGIILLLSQNSRNHEILKIWNENKNAGGVQYPPPPLPTGKYYTDQEKNIPEARKRVIAKKRSQSSHSMEILKSIVYGGLMELVTSLSIVSSAAASHATTSESFFLIWKKKNPIFFFLDYGEFMYLFFFVSIFVSEHCDSCIGKFIRWNFCAIS